MENPIAMNTPSPLRRVAIINRAIPGSGKSSVSERIVRAVREKGYETGLHSTDDYFMSPQGTYDFDPARLADCHRQNLAAFCRDVERGVPLVVCDNTNLSPWQSEDYIACARRHGYYVLILSYEPRDIAEHLKSQQVTPEKPDAHGVPEATLVEMAQEYHRYKKLLDKNHSIDPENDVREAWNPETLRPEKTSEPLRHYDADEVVVIHPRLDYDQAKTTLPLKILQLIGLEPEKRQKSKLQTSAT